MKKEIKIWKDKFGNKLTFKEFITKWGEGISGISPLQKLKTQIGGTKIMLIGLFLGLCVSIYGWKNLWWVGIILIGALLNTGVQYLGLKQQKKILDDLEEQFKEPEEDNVLDLDKINKERFPEKDNSQQPLELSRNTKSSSCEVEKDGFSPTDTGALTNGSVENSQPKSSLSPVDTSKEKVIILDDNELSIMKYAEEFPENWKKICNALDKEKGGGYHVRLRRDP